MTEHTLLRCPVVKASEVAAEGRYARSLRRAEGLLRERYGTSLDGLPPEIKERFRRRYRFKEWPYNHLCGAVGLVASGASALRADVYLSRRSFPRAHPEHRWRSPHQGDEVLLYATGSELLIMPGNNISYQQVAAILFEQARELVRSEGCGMRSAVVLVEPSLEAVDLASAHQQMVQRSRSRNPRQRDLL